MSATFTSDWLLRHQLRQSLGTQRSEPQANRSTLEIVVAHTLNDPLAAPEAAERDLHDKIEAECLQRGWLTVRSRMDRATTTRKGVCDFIIYADDGRMFHVECKSSTGKVSTDQRDFIAWAGKLGHTVLVVRSFREFLAVIGL